MTTRIGELDALRGFALLGIGLGNIMWFSGYAVATPQAREALGTASVDQAVAFAVHALVDGKFYALFSLIFGIAFARMVEHTRSNGARVAPVVARRLGALFVVGAVHATGLWFGDILSLYAVAAIPLLAMRRWSNRRLAIAVLVLLLAPVGTGALRLLMADVPAATAAGHGPAALLPIFGTGDYGQVLSANAVFLVERWALALDSGRLPRLLGMFALGMLLSRRHPIRPPRAGAMLWAVAIASNLALALLANAPGGAASLSGLGRDAIYSIAVPTGCLLYMALLWPRFAAPGGLTIALASAGRLSLSHYLAQSLIMSALFYGWGLGLWGHIGAAEASAVAIAVAGVQVALSEAWLRNMGAGPAERVLRALMRAGGPQRRRTSIPR